MARTSLDQQLSRLATLSPANLRDEWRQVCESPCPALPSILLQRGIAYRLQETKHGGLPASAIRALARIADGETKLLPAAAATLQPGTQLIREWQGRVVRVEVVEDGFLWDGKPYASLSSIAKAVTGAHWSGPRFFGVSGRV